MSKRKVRRWQIRAPALSRILLCACFALPAVWLAPGDARLFAQTGIARRFNPPPVGVQPPPPGGQWVTVSAGSLGQPAIGAHVPGELADDQPYGSPFERCEACRDEPWQWHLIPDGLIFRSYLAGARESRMASFWAYEKDEGWIWDATLGGRVGLLRFGTSSGPRPEGWQLDVEGAGMPRLSIDTDLDVFATDYRVGVPLTYGRGPYQMKIAYYHISSHLGDEFLLRNPTFNRLNYVRDALVWGHSYHVTPAVRVYGEAGWAFKTDGGAEPGEFQFGIDFSPPCPTGPGGAPFAAVNAHLREEVDFGGNLVVQAGWAWRGPGGGHLVRFGFEYFNGKDEQYSFFAQSQEKLGFGLWYDY